MHGNTLVLHLFRFGEQILKRKAGMETWHRSFYSGSVQMDSENRTKLLLSTRRQATATRDEINIRLEIARITSAQPI